MIKQINSYSEKQIQSLKSKFTRTIGSKAYPLGQGDINKVSLSYYPAAIPQKEYTLLKRELKLLVQTIIKLLEYLTKENLLQKELGLSDIEYELYKDTDYTELFGVLRFDLIVNKNKHKILEIDADPDALILHDVTFSHLKKYFPLNYKKSMPSHSTLLIKLFKAIKNAEVNLPNKGLLLIDPNAGFLEEYEINKRMLAQKGIEIEYAKFHDELDFDKYSFIRKAYELHHILEHNPSLLKSLKHKKLINPFAFRILGYKNLFITLYKYSNIFTKKENEIIKKLLPYTSYISAENISMIIDLKDKYVLKPKLGAEGDRVYVGQDTSKQEWSQLVSAAFEETDKWIIQEKIELGKILKKGTEDYYNFDFCPHLFIIKNQYKFGKILVRYSKSNILNVAKGGSFGYGTVL